MIRPPFNIHHIATAINTVATPFFAYLAPLPHIPVGPVLVEQSGMGAEDLVVSPPVNLTVGAILVSSWFSVWSFRRLYSERTENLILVPVDGYHRGNRFVGC